jgi:uncharacterized protein YfiM (DUF2279 family)
MTAFVLLPLLLAAADTGRAALVPPTVSIYVHTDINRQSTDSWIGEDKVKHLALSYMITVSAAASARSFSDRDDSIIAGAALGLIAGVGKEIVDRKKGSLSVPDLLWDITGITLAVLVEQQTRR